MIRKALQSLEKINWVEKAPKGGRRLTKQVSGATGLLPAIPVYSSD